jgi:NADH:ubiquinone oxidoreductase subunit E
MKRKKAGTRAADQVGTNGRGKKARGTAFDGHEGVSPIPPVPRFGHGSRVPGWDDAADLRKDPAVVPDAATTPVPADLRAEIEAHMAKYPDHRSASIPALAAAQRHHGWCSPEAIEQVACVMHLTPGYLFSVATFYDMLETHPVGRHSIFVCTNISCSLCGADDLLAAVLEAADGDPDLNIRSFECLGACDIAPMASVDGVYVGPVALDEVGTLVAQIKAGEPPLPAKQLGHRVVAEPLAAIPKGPTTYGGQMPEEAPGPPAPVEQQSPIPLQDEGQGEEGAT